MAVKSNAQSHIINNFKEVFKRNKIGTKVHFISYKNLHLFFNILTIYIYTLLPMLRQFSHPVNEEFQKSFLDP